MKHLRVLIIDDDKDIANLFQIILNMVGFECDVVHSGKEGLSRLAFSAPDVVLLDLRLGMEISGEDILFQIRSNPRLQQTRVIVITGYPRLAESVSELTDLILYKPVEIGQLKTLIQRVAIVDSKPGQVYFRDPVSGLFNQEFFYTRLDHAFERQKRRPDFIYGVIVFSADFESPFAEPVTPDIHDNLVRELARRLGKYFRPTDTSARFSKNKFAVLYEDLKRPEDIRVIARRLTNELFQPYQVEEKVYVPVVRLGSAVQEAYFTTPLEVLEAAENNLNPTFPLSEAG